MTLEDSSEHKVFIIKESVIKAREEIEDGKRRFLKMKLNEGISPKNVLAMLWLQVIIHFINGTTLSFITLIMGDPEYYDLNKTEVGTNLGYIGSVSQVCVLLVQAFMGLIQDTFGRKFPIVTGLLMAGVGLALIPVFTEVYPSLLIMKILISVGIVAGMNAPLLPDYIDPQSLGIAQAYYTMAINTAALLNQNLLYWLV